MKNLVPIIIITVMSLSLVSCNEKVEVKQLFENNEYKADIFNTILNDQILMKEFTTQMVNSGSASEVFMDDPEMVNHLINNDGLIDLLNNNPQAKENIINIMLSDSVVAKEVINKAIYNGKNSLQMIDALETMKILSANSAKDANEKLKAINSKTTIK